MSDNYISYEYDNGSINISEDAIAVMVGAALEDVEGVAGLSNTVGNELYGLLGKKSLSKGVKVQFCDNQVTADVLLTVKYGYNIASVAQKAQEAVSSEVEAMSGMGSPIVNVHVSGVAFDKN